MRRAFRSAGIQDILTGCYITLTSREAIIPKNCYFRKNVFTTALMKKTAFASAAFAFIILMFGFLFMLYELPFHVYIISLGLLLLAISMIIFYTLDKKAMYIAGSFFCMLPIAGLLFRQLNLPGANILLAAGLIAFALLFIPWYAITSYHD